jgi:hypothetical protein
VVAKRKSYQQEWVDLYLWRLARGGREGLIFIRPCQSASIHQQTAIFEATRSVIHRYSQKPLESKAGTQGEDRQEGMMGTF